ncbi:MAG: hypothetical protein ACETWG_03350 [Candidatus Neomarinimicrobiota bacterium]
MNSIRLRDLRFLICVLLPLMASGQDSGRKIHDAGLGFSFSSGQSLFYTRATNPYEAHHTYMAAGFHIEEEGIGLTYYNWYLDRYERTAKQTYYLELGWGWRHLWFQEKMAGGFFPHTVLEGGASGYFAQFGRLRTFFREMSLRWVPYVQAGVGASVYTGSVIYRIEIGYLSTLSYLPEGEFPEYEGAFLKMVISSGQKPR